MILIEIELQLIVVIGRIRCTTGKREASRLNAEKISSVPDDKGNFISTALRAVIQSRYWPQSLAVISFIGKHVPKSLSEISF